jgi:methylase of polypeptide subunit release factors
MTTRDERGALALFRERYALPATDVTDRIEAAVLGATWGANGYTTLQQANELAQRLELEPSTRLLDFGTGRGWPGVYYAFAYGCDVVATDLTSEGVTVAARRAESEACAARFYAIVATGAHQPFRRSAFDAIVHTDVLC